MGLLSFLNPLQHITDALTKAYAVREGARNSSERIKAEVQINELEMKRDVILSATVNDRWWSPRSIMGYSVAAFVFKIVVWDSVLQFGVTPYPGEMVTWIIVTIIGFYFVSRSAETIAGSIAGVLSRKHGSAGSK
jgi:hypothetical protein